VNLTPRRGARLRGRFASLVASIACLLSLTGADARRQELRSSADSEPAAARLSATPGHTSAFRLGTAAQPLGWSTAVGDFDTDGTPDLVIADHVSRWSGTYAYRIQFAVSGIGAHNFAFESSQAAVTVRVSDVDHDNDLDVIVHAAASREIVGIWLNDGHGRFEAADVRRFYSSLEPVGLLSTSDPWAAPARCGLPPRGGMDSLTAVPPAGLASVSQRLTFRDSPIQEPVRLSTTALRGPPASLA
jgi:hypothetical protein